MADLPENPNNREEEYLADLAGENGTKPANPWSRKEAYLDAIDGRMDNIETQVAALASDLSFKGSVADEAHLPSGAAVGDTYITENTGVMYVWTGTDWVALGGTGINVVQTTGSSTTSVMSQDATTKMIFDGGVWNKIKIGGATISNANAVAIGVSAEGRSPGGIALGSLARTTNSSGAYGAIAIGPSSYADGLGALAIGGGNGSNDTTSAVGTGCVAIGAGASNNVPGSVHIGTVRTNLGYGGNSNYRLLTGLYDPQSAHDAATKGYVDTLVGNIESALHAINNGGNA